MHEYEPQPEEIDIVRPVSGGMAVVPRFIGDYVRQQVCRNTIDNRFSALVSAHCAVFSLFVG